MPPDASATKARLLAAALDEFSRFGLAGARVDRIALAANANKRSIYVYFGNKNDLFDFVVGRSLAQLAEAVPFEARDLPAYAARLFDYLLDHSQILRLTNWAQLERPEPTRVEIEAYRPKVEAVAAAQRDGVIASAHDPADLLALVLAITTTWANTSPALRILAAGPPTSQERLQSQRAAVIDAVRKCIGSAE